ncbi:MAG TPA: phosphomannomutase/phosphoglucomutase [Candidatus Paceibacterota bacterium]|nr:phosphomannomutase/phosphoglucomutase [Candidatus Paceibacterota bacterium]
MASLKKTMFREYDIRGRESEDELNETSVYHIARGFAAMLRGKNITKAVVGHDARATSDHFHARVVAALRESGVDVVDIGTVTTPMSYWAQFHFKVDGLVMVTASHNPAGWNGVKLGTGLAKTLLAEEVKTLYSIIEREEYVTGTGEYTKEDIAELYMNDLLSRVTIGKKFKLLVNTGNGTAGLFAPTLLRKTGSEVIERYTDVDPSYPHYTANPDGTGMMSDTGAQAKAHGCDLGIAFDGDGDRMGITDETGATIWPDRYLILLSRLVLKKQPGSTIVFDVKVSEALPEDIAAHGGIPIMCRTGHSYIKAKLAEEKAALAGEMSGHIFFAQDFYGFDDAFFAALKLLEYLSSQDKPLSQIISDTPSYVSTPTIQVKSSDEKKYVIVEKLTEEFKNEGYHVVDINGARVYFSDGWGLVRASSNTPTLVLRFESKTQEGLDKIRSVFHAKLDALGLTEWDSSGH